MGPLASSHSSWLWASWFCWQWKRQFFLAGSPSSTGDSICQARHQVWNPSVASQRACPACWAFAGRARCGPCATALSQWSPFIVISAHHHTDEQTAAQSAQATSVRPHSFQGANVTVFFFKILLISHFIFGCAGSLLLCTGFLELWCVGSAL